MAIDTALRVEYIKKNYKTMSVREMSQKLMASRRTVADILVRIKAGKTPSPRCRDWGQEDLQYLFDHAGTSPQRDISVHLDRSIPDVRRMVEKYGLKAMPRTEGHCITADYEPRNAGKPCSSGVGSKGKVEAMRLRVENDEPIFHEEDSSDCEGDFYSPMQFMDT